MQGRWAGLRGHVIVICALFGCAAWTAPASAQPFPSRPITLVGPFAAGGPTDTLARILSERIAAELHTTIVVENVAGASGSIAGARVARATPDGTMITIGHWGTHVLNGAIFKLPYDVIADFEPVATIAMGTQLIVGRKSLEANTLKEMIAWLKANPGKVTAGTAGAGTGAPVAGVFFQGENRHRLPVRALSRRGARHDRSRGRADRHHVRSGLELAAALQERCDQGVRGDVADAARLRARYPDGRRGGVARSLHLLLARHLGTEEHAEGDRHKAQRGDRHRACRRFRQAAVWRIWGRRFLRPISKRPQRSEPSRRPRPRNGGRS